MELFVPVMSVLDRLLCFFYHSLLPSLRIAFDICFALSGAATLLPSLNVRLEVSIAHKQFTF
ncbi:hypothetical protein BDV37DRAFT_243335 [Aspergillus pseudonomiae]|uniref:Uncharacterized protein n=1 Tax=Aspergillus pseudonomiae TaxID=1506151 RepID=A0A5N7DI99_9EURO|nr:uncharacterized protein BDV37DRAFT_243335 [Aspergillus pseudonomiae]KAE8406171.1 hypothetical protein BDV37DRAFT_243335 [Aspergillus pseudonomiae]